MFLCNELRSRQIIILFQTKSKDNHWIQRMHGNGITLAPITWSIRISPVTKKLTFFFRVLFRTGL